jgi:hypothetical protein
MKRISSFIIAGLALAALSACGGGGDSGQQVGSTPAVAISSTNQTPVAQATISGGLSVSQTPTSSSTASTTPGTRAATAVLARTHALAAVQAATNGRRTAASVHAESTSSTSESCSVSGTVTTTFDDHDNSGTSSTGDVLTITYAQCKDSATSSINGTLAMTLTATPTSTQIVTTTAFQNIVEVYAGVTTTINGSVALTETDSDTGFTEAITVGSGGFAIAESSSTYADTITYASGTRIASEEVYASGEILSSVDGSYSSQSLGGNVTVATVEPVVQASGDSYPSSGQIRATGALGSTLLITVFDATEVELQLDANGDGTYESTTYVPWATLLP